MSNDRMSKMTPREKRCFVLLFSVLSIVGAFLRFFLLGRIPFGLNQDEASIGYDAFALARYGIDRNGYPWPVYPITWGSGGGSPLMVYLTVLSTRLLGRNVFSLRFFPALLGSLTPPLLALLPFLPPAAPDGAGKGPASFAQRAALSLSLLFLAVINPWHLILSRWALDANTLPFFLALSVFFFVFAANSGAHRLPKYLLSAFCFALCPYAYGSATIVIPLLLLSLALFLYRSGRMTVRELLLSALTFLIVLSPLILFFAVNALDLPAIVTPFFSVPRLTASRSVFHSAAQLPATLKKNLRYLLIFLTVGAEKGEIHCNYVSGYAQMYRFTFPLTFLGLSVSLRKMKKGHIADACMLLLSAMTILFSLFIELDINRMTLLLIPLLWYQARALSYLFQKRRRAALIICTVILCASTLFVRDYFGDRYALQSKSEDFFMPGYIEAVREASALSGNDRPICSTYTHLSAPFILALYASETPPREFLSTVLWKDASAEFRIAKSFGRFTFGLPDNPRDIDPASILILHLSELDDFPNIKNCRVRIYGDFAVVSQ